MLSSLFDASRHLIHFSELSRARALEWNGAQRSGAEWNETQKTHHLELLETAELRIQQQQRFFFGIQSFAVLSLSFEYEFSLEFGFSCCAHYDFANIHRHSVRIALYAAY